MKPLYLPKATGSFDFVIIGSKAAFFAMLIGAVIAAAAVIFAVKKHGK